MDFSFTIENCQRPSVYICEGVIRSVKWQSRRRHQRRSNPSIPQSLQLYRPISFEGRATELGCKAAHSCCESSELEVEESLKWGNMPLLYSAYYKTEIVYCRHMSCMGDQAAILLRLCGLQLCISSLTKTGRHKPEIHFHVRVLCQDHYYNY